METIYIILEDNGDDGFNAPYNDVFYISQEKAESDCKALNKASGSKRDYYTVYELTLKN